MSSNGSEDGAAFDRLRGAVDAALGEIDRLRGEVQRAREQGAELEEMLRGVTSGEQSPREMLERLNRLEDENRDFRERLFEGRSTVDRLLARIQFLEDQR